MKEKGKQQDTKGGASDAQVEEALRGQDLNAPDDNPVQYGETPAGADEELSPISTDEYGAEFEELLGQLNELTTALEQERDRHLRLMAEFDNYRKRTQGEFRSITQQAGERVVRRLLPVLDDILLLLAQDSSKLDVSSVRQGMELISQKFERLLNDEGVTAVPALGQPFDADLHDAVALVEDPSVPAGQIIAEVQRGYTIGDKVLRHAKVVVARASDPLDEEDGSQRKLTESGGDGKPVDE